MAKDRQSVTCNGKPALYAAIYEDIRQAAMSCGWEVAIHGSLANDMDIMAMKWHEDATDADTMIDTIIERCFGDSVISKFGKTCIRNEKPHGRVCYAIPIYGDHYLDISLIE